MRLKDYLRSDLVLPRLRATTVEGVVQELARHLAEKEAVPSREEVARGLLERERGHSTALGHGIALPHTTVDGIDQPVVLVAMAAHPVRFGPADTDPVRVFFVLLSPPGHEGEHVKLLARVCRLARHPGFVDALQRAETGPKALEIIQRAEQDQVDGPTP